MHRCIFSLTFFPPQLWIHPYGTFSRMQPIFLYYCLIYKSCGFCFLIFLQLKSCVWGDPIFAIPVIDPIKEYIVYSYIMGLEIKYNWI